MIHRILLLAPLLLAACDSTPVAVTEVSGQDEIVSASLDTTVELRVGQIAYVEDAGVYLRFVELLFDERCSQDVYCVWAGNAAVRLRANRPPFGQQVVELETHTERSADVSHDLRVRLIELLPRLNEGESPDPARYRLTIRVERR